MPAILADTNAHVCPFLSTTEFNEVDAGSAMQRTLEAREPFVRVCRGQSSRPHDASNFEGRIAANPRQSGVTEVGATRY
jgi:hypothetical protein